MSATTMHLPSSGGCSPSWPNVSGITLYMQPVQDLTVEDRVSRTQFQYSIEDADAQELAQWTPKLVEKLRAAPALRDVATDQLNGGLRTNLTIDRDTASRLGILPQAIDNTLYDAFGQRQVSIIFTQLNQYHVVLEVMPNFAKTPDAMNDVYVRPSSTIAEFRRTHAPMRPRQPPAELRFRFPLLSGCNRATRPSPSTTRDSSRW